MKQTLLVYLFSLLFVPFNFRILNDLTLYLATESAKPFDIIINEIMEDPTIAGGGTLGLPDREYVELFNRSYKFLSLEGFNLSNGTTRIATFPAVVMPPHSYLIIAKDDEEELANFGRFLGMPVFPALRSSDELVLCDEFGDIMDIVHYDQEWYHNSAKARGGFSLERIHPQQPCEGQSNWIASNALSGGTPGRENAVFDDQKKAQSFDMINAYPVRSDLIRLTFSKKIHWTGFENETAYTLLNHRIVSVMPDEHDPNSVLLEVTPPLVENQLAQVKVNTFFRDCTGQEISPERSFPIGLPIRPRPSDIVINEILFNPQTGGTDFLELINRSEGLFDLNGLFLINRHLSNPIPQPVRIERLLFPGEIIAFTKSPTDIQLRYKVNNPNALIKQELPGFGDNEGNVALFIYDALNTVFIDEFDYTQDLHHPLLNDRNGVSLERINPDLPARDKGNWHSASAEVGYATPAYQNSQWSQVVFNKQPGDFLFLSGNRLSPDGDGFEDVLIINYATDRPGYSASVHIYDAAGRLIDKLVQNQLLSTSGSFKWEGMTAGGLKARPGIYVLWVEYLYPDGQVCHLKKAVVLAEKI